MQNQWTRRNFLQHSALLGAAAAGTAFAADPAPTDSAPSTHSDKRSLTPSLLLAGTAALCKPSLAASQLSFRLALARTRTANYPLDSMDFIMMDLERPDNRSRHAHWCVGDLSGRLLEFLCCAEGIDGRTDSRIESLFERILKQRRPSGIIGRYGLGGHDGMRPATTTPEDHPLLPACCGRHGCGLLRYYALTGDVPALEAAVGLGNCLWTVRDAWRAMFKSEHHATPYTWTTEFFARLYAVTRDARWLEFCGMIRDGLTNEPNCHAHFLMTSLRGLQWTALATGDASWSEKPERLRHAIIERRLEMPDGCTPESFPQSPRNEGCSIADWLMLNLNAGLLGDDSAYEKAERIFWNALAFNQWINGSFGHRGLLGNGYGVTDIGEAWWCCAHHAGMAMSEFARHTVVFRKGAICVNFLTPGRFSVPLSGGRWAEVAIATNYPSDGNATIEANSIPADVAVRLRVPACLRQPSVKETRTGDRVRIALQGSLTHHVEPCRPGVILTYGPLILVPATGLPQNATATGGAPPGYVPQSLPSHAPTIKLDKPADADGNVRLPLCPSERPLPDWSYFDEGPGAPTWVNGSSVEARLRFAGVEHAVRLTPMCYNTSNLSFFETPVVFRSVE